MPFKKIVVSNFTVKIQKAPEGGYTGRSVELLGAISEGETLAELKKNMNKAIQLVLDTLRDMKVCRFK